MAMGDLSRGSENEFRGFMLVLFELCTHCDDEACLRPVESWAQAVTRRDCLGALAAAAGVLSAG